MPFTLRAVTIGVDEGGKVQRTLVAEVQPPDRGAKALKPLTPAQEKMMVAFANVHRAHGDAFGERGVSAAE
jgi:hypothetical protein